MPGVRYQVNDKAQRDRGTEAQRDKGTEAQSSNRYRVQGIGLGTRFQVWGIG